ncbi:MAG TPA: AI-2E family transporter [Ktedonobacterales bacterium]|nr:AI-2E family transporter [Ktedonobacterales bacterium]
MTLETQPLSTSSEQASVHFNWPRRLLIPLSFLAWGFLIFLTFVLAGHIIETLILLGVAVLIAYALLPIVNRLDAYMPRWLAITITYVVFGGAIAAFIFLIVDTVTREVAALSGYVQHVLSGGQAQSLLQRVGLSSGSIGNGDIFGRFANIAGSIVPVVTGVASAAIGIVVIIVLSIYFVAAAPSIGRWLRTQTPINHRERVNYFLDTVNRIVGGYIRGQVTLAAIVGLLVGLGMQFLFHLPFAVLLGLLAFVLEFIPFLGVIVSGAACVLVALTQGFIVALLVLGYFVGVHVIEGEVLGPRIVGSFVGLHPAVELIVLIAGAELFGLWGALFAAPVAGIIQAFAETFWMEYRRTHPDLFPGLAAGTAPGDSSDGRSPGGDGFGGKKGRRSERFRGIFFRHPPRRSRTP